MVTVAVLAAGPSTSTTSRSTGSADCTWALPGRARAKTRKRSSKVRRAHHLPLHRLEVGPVGVVVGQLAQGHGVEAANHVQ